MDRIWNFNAGPAALPLPVLQQAKEELLNYRNSGMSIMEHSHRGAHYDQVHHQVMTLLRELMAIPEDYKVLFLQGGASLQFAMVPMNLLHNGESADYILTGAWSEKALKEARIIARARVAASSADKGFSYIPSPEQLHLDANAVYVHVTSNNTIFGTQWPRLPETGSVPLVVDMSSDILSRPIDMSGIGIIYAGAQKNLGPAGLTVVIIRDDLVARGNPDVPTMLSYQTHVHSNSLYNTPPTFAIYILGLVLEWVKERGGVAAVEQENRKKARLLYDAIDASEGFYRGVAEKNSRSLMNVCMRLRSDELEKKFIQESIAAGFSGLKGHRSVGGVRASIYNAVPLQAVEDLVAFMHDFQQRFQS